ncbi:hypothetical protein N2152v2_007910 [Parachlorella kessleri]
MQGAALEAEQEPENQPGEEQQPISKNQLKKLRKQQRYEEQKRQRRAAEKAARQAKQEQRRAEGLERMATMTEEEKQRWREERRAKVEARKQESQGKKAKLHQALDEGQRLVIDLDFEDKMSESEIKSLCQQLSYAYGANTKAVVPCHFVFTSLKGRMRDHITRQLTGFENWVSTQTEQDYMQHFGDKAVGQLVYLTADSPDEITELDPAKAYIIGGLVDRNRYKGLCYQKAQEQGIATARLPIGEFMKLASSQVMTTNHVVDIILRWLELRDWEAAFNAVIPTRKRKHEEATEADDNGNLEDRPHKQQQQQQQQHETRVEACGGAGQAAAAGAVASQGRAQDGEAGPSPNAAAVPAQGGEGGPTSWLLTYRLLAFVYALAIGVWQLARVGPRVFVFFTVWNWWFLTFYFALGSFLSFSAWQRQRRQRFGQAGGVVPSDPPATTVGKLLVCMYHIEAPLVWVIDFTTWLVLVPMLLAVADDEKRKYWVAVMYSFTSYNQHGFNAVMMLGELALSRLPANFYMSGYMALWLSAFAAWSTLFFARTGRFIYPFLDAHKPYAWVVYLSLYASFWAAFLLFLGLHWAKGRLLEPGLVRRVKLQHKVQ